MATRQSNNYGFTLQDNNEFVDIETTAANFEKVDAELKKISDKAVINASDISRLEAAAAKLEKDIAALKASQESGGTVSAETAAKITALESQLTTVNANITNLKTRVSTLEGKMTTAESNIDTLESDMDAAESDIDNLESKMTTAEGDIDALESDMDAAEKDIDNLEAEMQNLKDSQQGSSDWEVLWEHDADSLGKVMSETEMIYLKKDIKNLKFGLEFIFAFAGETHFYTKFISKEALLNNTSDGVADYFHFLLMSPSATKQGEKILCRSGSNSIRGYANNAGTGNIDSITFYNGDFTLYKVNGM